MASLSLSLNRRARIERQRLLALLDLVSLYLSAGFDLSYAWAEARKAGFLPVGKDASLLGEIEVFAAQLSNPVHRVWFRALRDLYREGAPVQALLSAFADQVRKERMRDMESFARQLPTRANLLLLLFFLPAAFLLLFAPLLLQLSQAFSP